VGLAVGGAFLVVAGSIFTLKQSIGDVGTDQKVLNSKMDGLKTEMDANQTKMDSKMDGLKTEMDANQTKMDAKMDANQSVTNAKIDALIHIVQVNERGRVNDSDVVHQ
jgi:outer membrane murein-binding lipoprotein Lpp